MTPAPVPPDGEPDTAGIEAAKQAVYESMPVVLKDLVSRSEAEAAIGVPHGAGVPDRWLADVAVRAYLAAGRAAATPDPPIQVSDPKVGECPTNPSPVGPATPDPPDHGPAIGLLRAAAVQREIAANHNHPAEMTVLMASWEGLRLAADLLEREAGMVHRCEPAPASPDERLREALRDANEYLAQIADYSPSEVADAIDSVRAQIKDALAATDSRGKPDGASVPDQSCATCGGSGDRNGNRRAADPFGTCPGCGGTGNVAAADREAPEPRELGDIDTGEGWYET